MGGPTRDGVTNLRGHQLQLGSIFKIQFSRSKFRNGGINYDIKSAYAAGQWGPNPAMFLFFYRKARSRARDGTQKGLSKHRGGINYLDDKNLPCP